MVPYISGRILSKKYLNPKQREKDPLTQLGYRDNRDLAIRDIPPSRGWIGACEIKN